jgi:hypothetical protein
MTDYDADHDGDQTLDDGTWPVDLWKWDINYPLTRACIWIAALAVAGWVLTQALTP